MALRKILYIGDQPLARQSYFMRVTVLKSTVLWPYGTPKAAQARPPIPIRIRVHPPN